jgi:hypothetical protein
MLQELTLVLNQVSPPAAQDAHRHSKVKKSRVKPNVTPVVVVSYAILLGQRNSAI